jgi:hypothetical protein
VIVAVAIVTLTAVLSSDRAALRTDLASETAVALVAGSLVAYVFERVLQGEKKRQHDAAIAVASLTISPAINQSVGAIASRASLELREPLGISRPKKGTPLHDALTSLADQLTKKLDGHVWRIEDSGEQPTLEDRERAIVEDKFRVLTDIVPFTIQTLENLRNAVTPLLASIGDTELLTILNGTESHRLYLVNQMEDWHKIPRIFNPHESLRTFPHFLRAGADAVAIIEKRTRQHFEFEMPIKPADEGTSNVAATAEHSDPSA